MLRLHPSSIVLTHEEVNKVLTESNPPSTSAPFTSAHPWDHTITVRWQRRKEKQKASETDQDILSELRSLRIGGEEEEQGREGDMETDASTGAGPSSLDVSADDIPRPPGVHAPNEEGSRGKRRERIETSPESEDPTLSSEPSMISSSGVDRAFSADDFNASNWAVYGDDLPDDYRDADTDEIDEEDEEDDDVYNDEYLADGEPDFNNSEASDPSGQGDYPPNPPPNLPLRPLVARHIPVDGTSETEVGIDIVNEDPEYTAFNPGPALHDSTIPLPNSSRFHPRLLDTMNSPSSSRMAILNDRDVVAATLGHIDHRYVGMNRYLGRSAVSLSQDDAMDSSYRRWSSATAPAGNDIDDSSDDSFSGFQLPADTIAELEERKRRRQAEAAKRTIR